MIQISQLELERAPFSVWVRNVIQISREKGYTDNDIKSWIKEWARSRDYPDQYIYSVLKQNGIRIYNRRPVIYKRYPKLTVCPKCVSVGKINVYYPNGKLSYVIKHEKIKGMWGKTKQVSRHRRCYIYHTDKESSEYVRQQLEFYEKRDRYYLEELEKSKPKLSPIPPEILAEINQPTNQ